MKKNKVEILALIPARGGSERVPKKNVKMLHGKPLIAHTIETAQKSSLITRVLVSTEDQEIANVSSKYGAEVINQPMRLAKSRVKTVNVVFNVLSLLKKENYIPEVVVLLQPTSPLRNSSDIDNAIVIFLNNKCESVVSVCEADPSFHWALKTKNNYLDPVFNWDNFLLKSQDLPKVYRPTGAIFVFSSVFLSKNKSFYGKKTMPYLMPRERGVDIDSEFDFILTEHLMKNDNHGKN